MILTKDYLMKLPDYELMNLINTCIKSNTSKILSLRSISNTSSLIDVFDAAMEHFMQNNDNIRVIVAEIERRHIP